MINRLVSKRTNRVLAGKDECLELLRKNIGRELTKEEVALSVVAYAYGVHIAIKTSIKELTEKASNA